MNNVRIGIMGGTFDPPHIGHLISAEVAASALGLSKVIFIPTGPIVYKTRDKSADPSQRLEMTMLSVEDNNLFEISDIEVSSNETTYTYKTLESLKETYKDEQLYFIVGADSLDYMERWKNPERIFELCSVAVVGRNGFTQEESKAKAEFLKVEFGADIVFVDMPEVDISSSDIKRRIENGDSVRYMVTEAVFEYINANLLYI